MADKNTESKILPDLDRDYASRFKCETCEIDFNDEKTYKSHMLGKKHAKKSAENKLKAKSQVRQEKHSESENEDSDTEMHCETCDKDFTGYISYAAHLKGSLHAKNVKKQKLKNQLDDMPEVIKKKSEDSDSEDDGILPKPYAKCSTCQKEFSGPESFKMHMKSAKHLKKVQQAKSLENFKKDNGENSDGEEIYSKCDTCQKSFSGLVPYQIHMQSNVHKKSVEKKKIAEEIKEFCHNTDFNEGYVCKECQKTFTDPLGFKCHLLNNSHEKQKAKLALEEFLKANPEIVYVTPPYHGEGSGASEDEFDSVYYLICKICQTSFSGPESATDHVKSKKHLSIKRERNMMKLMKKKQDSPQTTTGDDKSVQAPSSIKRQINGSKNGKKDDLEEFELI